MQDFCLTRCETLQGTNPGPGNLPISLLKPDVQVQVQALGTTVTHDVTTQRTHGQKTPISFTKSSLAMT